MSSIGVASTGVVRDLYLQDDTGTIQSTVYFDDIRLLRSSTPPPTEPPPTEPPPATPAFTLYADSLHTTFKDRSWATRNRPRPAPSTRARRPSPSSRIPGRPSSSTPPRGWT
ncbi:hypothetical protein ACN28S_20350 [Cystobacter fuscus]